MTIPRALFGVALVAMIAFLGYRVVQAGADEREDDPRGDVVERLQADPLDGDAFSDLAVESREAGDQEASLALHRIAARRDPRDLRIRAWLAQYRFATKEHAKALAQLDVMLRLSPELRPSLLPMMAKWTDDAAYAEALAATLQKSPAWGDEMMAALRKEIARPGAGDVVDKLRAAGALDKTEWASWLDALLRAGHWDQAYRFWTTGLDLAPGVILPVPYNGDFEQAPSQLGFDWRTGRRPGTYTEFEATGGANGQAAHLVFLGRPVAAGDLEQPLVLAPGDYRLSMRAKGAGLHSDQGLHWTVTCHGKSRPVAASERLHGSFDWRGVVMLVEIPETGCPGQWLRLANPAPRGSARMVSGELWIDDMTLRRLTGRGGGSR